MKNPYTILGVSRSATSDEIKKAYKKLVKEYHPDINPNAKEKFEEIQQAYSQITESPQYNYNTSGYAPDINLDKIFGNFKKPEIVQIININVNLTLQELHNGCEKIIQLDDKHHTKIKLPIPAGTFDQCHFTTKVHDTKYKIVAHININIDNNFYLVSNILHKKIYMTAKEFIETDKIEIENHIGEKFVINLNSKTSSGSLIRLPKKGLYNSDKNTTTDLLIQLVITKGE